MEFKEILLQKYVAMGPGISDLPEKSDPDPKLSEKPDVDPTKIFLGLRTW